MTNDLGHDVSKYKNGKPNSVKIGWKDVKIEYVDPSFFKNNVDCYGQYISRTGTIEIQKEIKGVDLANTVLHEIMHAIVYNSSLNSEGGALSDGKDEEQVVNSMCNQLMMVFRDNTWLLDFIKDGIHSEENSTIFRDNADPTSKNPAN